MATEPAEYGGSSVRADGHLRLMRFFKCGEVGVFGESVTNNSVNKQLYGEEVQNAINTDTVPDRKTDNSGILINNFFKFTTDE